MRLEFRLSRGGGDEFVFGDGRHGNGRLGGLPIGKQSLRGAQAHRRFEFAGGHYSDRPQPGHSRPDVPERYGRGDHVERAEVPLRLGNRS